MRGVVLRQVRIGLRVAEIVDRDDLDLVGALRFVQRAQDVAADSSVTVDTHFDRHLSYFLLNATMKGVVRPAP